MYRLFLASLLALSLALTGHARAEDCFDTVYQVSTITNLMSGAFDGTVSVGDMMKHGGFGIGTFDRLDGEMVVLDGVCYQVKADGTVSAVERTATTPFAVVTEFESDRVGTPVRPLDSDGLEDYVDALEPDMNIPVAVKVSGTFAYVRTRSVPPQEKPYPRLVVAVKRQSTFEFRDVKGTLVGFRMPAFMDGVNVPGYHMHFITDDRVAGGHVLALDTGRVTVQVDDTPEFRMTVPRGIVNGKPSKGMDSTDLKVIEGGR